MLGHSRDSIEEYDLGTETWKLAPVKFYSSYLANANITLHNERVYIVSKRMSHVHTYDSSLKVLSQTIKIAGTSRGHIKLLVNCGGVIYICGPNINANIPSPQKDERGVQYEFRDVEGMPDVQRTCSGIVRGNFFYV